MLLRKLPLCFLGAALAATVLTTGCRDHHHDDRRDEPQPAAQTQAAPSETVIYNQWETDTHRPHKEIAQRTADEQREYRDWRQSHPNGR
jgi:hypothetical protein